MNTQNHIARPDIAQHALLASTSVSVWTARKLDQKVTQETNARHGAASDAGRYNKALIAKKALVDINAAAAAIRSIHYTQTLPWTDEGLRALPIPGARKYSDDIKAAIQHFNTLADQFADAYPQYIDEARVTLGDMFNPADYPHPNDIRAKFAARFRIVPISTAEHIPEGVDDSTAAELGEAIQAQHAQAMDLATVDIWKRAHEAVSAMAERLTAYEPGADGQRAKGIFRDSLVTNVIELANAIPTLNIANNPHLNRIANDMADLLTYYSAEQLRANSEARATVAEDARTIAASIAERIAYATR